MDMMLCKIFGVSCGTEGQGHSLPSDMTEDCDVSGIEVGELAGVRADGPADANARFTALSITVFISSSVSRSRTNTLPT